MSRATLRAFAALRALHIPFGRSPNAIDLSPDFRSRAES
jgi:hypothetical protein